MTWVNVLESKYVRAWEERQRAPVEAVSTGLATLDGLCGDDGGRIGLARGWFVTLGGNPGHGKSLLALNMAASFITQNQSVAFLTLEMSPEQLSTRVYAIAMGDKVWTLERGDSFEPNDLANRVNAHAVKHGFAEMHVNDQPLGTIEEVMAYLNAAADAGIKIVIVDYLQLIGAGSEDSLYQQVAEIAMSMRKFAHQRQVLTIGLSQYNRRTSAERGAKPTAQSLHGGMSLEANSDMVLLLDHSRYERDTQHPHLARTWVIVGKNRHGPQVDIPVQWDYRTLRIREALPDEEGKWPE